MKISDMPKENAVSGNELLAVVTGGVNMSAAMSDVAQYMASFLTNAGFLSTDAFTGDNQLLALNGYQKLPGGLILQWHTDAAPETDIFTQATQTQAINFPIPFPNKCLFAVATMVGSAAIGGATSVYTTLNSDISNTGLTVRFEEWGPQGPGEVQSMRTSFFAIGY